MANDVITIGVVNFAPVIGDKAATVDKLEATVHEAGRQGVDLVVFPETALIGADACPECLAEAGPCATHLSLAETVPGPTTERVARLAREHDLTVAFGLAERDRADARTLYNAAAVVGPDGVLGTYRKINLGAPPWVTEGLTFAPGTELPVWPTRHGPIGVLICYDFWLNPELCRILALKGARVIANCTASFAGPGKHELFVHTTSVRAAENLVYTASANLVTAARGSAFGGADLDAARPGVFAGGSTIAGPAFPRFATVYAEASEEEELVSATLSFTKLDRWREVFPWREWRSGRQKAVSELVAREFAALADPH